MKVPPKSHAKLLGREEEVEYTPPEEHWSNHDYMIEWAADVLQAIPTRHVILVCWGKKKS